MADFYEFLNKMDGSHPSKKIEDDYEDEDFNINDEDDENDEDDDEEENNIEMNNNEDDDFEDEDDENNEEEKNIEDDENDELDIIEKSLEYSKSVIKIIKTNFSKKEQKIMLQTLRNTIDTVLGTTYSSVQFENKSVPVQQNQQVEQKEQSIKQPVQNVSAQSHLQYTMSEEEWNNYDPNNSYGVPQQSTNQIPVEQLSLKTSATAQVNESRHRSYNKNLPLAVKVNSDGQREVDLSKISNKDVDDLKVLMGIK